MPGAILFVRFSSNMHFHVGGDCSVGHALPLLVQLSLFAEIFHEMLEWDFGSKILEFFLADQKQRASRRPMGAPKRKAEECLPKMQKCQRKQNEEWARARNDPTADGSEQDAARAKAVYQALVERDGHRSRRWFD